MALDSTANSAPRMTEQQRRDASFIQRSFKDRRDTIRRKRLDPATVTFDDGLESYITEDADCTGRTLQQFIEFAMPYTPLYQGQVMQDVWALFELDGKKGGYFVDFGATNGTTLSNSYALEKYMDWDGIVAEPNPTFHERLMKTRNCNVSTKCVHSKTGASFEFICANRPMFSRLTEASEGMAFADEEVEQTISVPTISLNDLLDEYDAPEVIDFVSIDTEGSELDILSTFDFSRRQVNLFAVEHNFEPRREAIHAMMTDEGYVRRFPEMSRFDDWYIHNSLL